MAEAGYAPVHRGADLSTNAGAETALPSLALRMPNADRRAALFAEIEALGAQAWMTGTEWGLFEALGTGAQRVAVREGGDGSVLSQQG